MSHVSQLSMSWSRIREHRAVSWFVSLSSLALCPLAALALGIFFKGRIDPALLFVLAVILPSWVGGAWPGMASVGLSATAMVYYFVPPEKSFAIAPGEIPYVIFFVLTATAVSVLASMLARSKRAQRELPKLDSESGATSRQLASWKETAEYLGVNVRTAQRWEQEKGLPVKRFAGERGRVVATTEELDRWKEANLSGQNIWSNIRFLRAYGIAASAALLLALGIGLGVWLHSQVLGPPTRLRIEDREIIVADSEGRERWRHVFAEAFLPNGPRTMSWFGHLGSRTNVDTLFAYAPTRMSTSHSLLCFSEAGKQRWSFEPGKLVSDGQLTYPPVYFINGFRVLPQTKEAPQKIAVSSNHGWSYPNQVAILDSDGKMIGEYWHSGHLRSMEAGSLGPNGSTRLVLAGVDNGRHQATAVFFDPNNVHGAEIEDNPKFQLQGFGPGTETAIVWFERSCLNEASEEFNEASEIVAVPGGLQVVVNEVPRESVYVVYVLDKDLNVTYVEVSSGFKSLHRRLEQERRITHSFSDDEVKRLAHVRVVRR